MAVDPIRIISRIATALASAASLRDGCSDALDELTQGLGARYAFLARPSPDGGVADVFASHGLHAADFRRLEERLGKSGLWRILSAATPFVIDDLGQDPVLNFLAFATHAHALAAAPLPSTRGMLVAGFSTHWDENRTLRVLETAAALVSHSIRVDQTIVAENERLSAENRRLKNELKERYDFGNLVGNSGGMRQALDRVRQIAKSNTPVFLRGEAGTGKDLFATAIRYNSLRSKRPLVKFDLALVARVMEELTEKLRSVEGGTLFIDEISAASPEAQARILDVIRNVKGSTRDRPPEYNIRFILSSSRDDGALAGELLPALYEELSPHTIFLPPLRERKSDILLLAEHFLDRFAEAEQKSILRISTPAIDMLAAYHFPGNVRELENAIQHAVTVCDSNVLHGHHLPPTLQTAEVTGTETRVTLDTAVATFERDLIQDALKSTGGNVAKAARMLDSTERILGYKIRKYDLDPRRFKKWR